MSKPLYLDDLEQALHVGCSTPGCTEDHDKIFLHPRCHLDGRIEVSYSAGDDFLLIGCQECHKEIARVQVQRRVVN